MTDDVEVRIPPRFDPAAALLFVINASAGAHDIEAKRATIEAALAARGRKGELLVCVLPAAQIRTNLAALNGGGIWRRPIRQRGHEGPFERLGGG